MLKYLGCICKPLLKNKLEIFIVKRVAIIFIIFSILDIIIIGQRWAVLAGLALGGLMSLIRLRATVSTYGLLSPDCNHKAVAARKIANYVFHQLFTIILLIVSIKVGLWFFAGIVTGILLVPGVIFVNGITEGLGITHNSFE